MIAQYLARDILKRNDEFFSIKSYRYDTSGVPSRVDKAMRLLERWNYLILVRVRANSSTGVKGGRSMKIYIPTTR